MGFLWYLQGSNQGHMDFQSIALPSELRYHANAGANIRQFFKFTNKKLKKKDLFYNIIKYDLIIKVFKQKREQTFVLFSILFFVFVIVQVQE